MSQKPAVRDNRGTPPHLTLTPEAGERGFFRLPLPLGEGWGEGAFPRIDAQSCYDFWCVPSFETVSFCVPCVSEKGSPISDMLTAAMFDSQKRTSRLLFGRKQN